MLLGLDTRYLRLCLPLNRPHAAIHGVQDRLLFFPSSSSSPADTFGRRGPKSACRKNNTPPPPKLHDEIIALSVGYSPYKNTWHVHHSFMHNRELLQFIFICGDYMFKERKI